MKIVFDNIIFSKEKQGGISNYWYELIKRYEDKTNVFFYEEKNATCNIFRKKLKLQNTIIHKSLPLPLARILPIKYSTSSENLLYHSSFYRNLNCNFRVCEITTVHDFLHNKFSPFIKKTIHNKLKYNSIKRSAGIICVSNHTYNDLKKSCSTKKYQKTTVIYNGVSNDYKPLIKEDNLHKTLFTKLNITDKFLLFVGARSNYKNFDFVIELIAKLPGYKLVVVGNRLNGKENSKINKLVAERIIIAESISNNDLNILYNYAQALLYPSSYEGFGIPVIEAMKAGCPVLALNLTSIPEVAGGAALLFDNLNINEFINAIKLLEQTEKREILITSGIENAKRFNWEKCYNETSQFYEETYKGWQ